jgi:glycosyltransferase involved in cell wall biosynthesis
MKKKLIMIIENSTFVYSGAKVRNDNLIKELKNDYIIVRISLKWIVSYEQNTKKNLNLLQLCRLLLVYNFSIRFMTDLFLVSLLFPFPIIFTVHDMKDWTKYKRRGKFKKLLFKLMYYKPGISWISVSDYVKHKLKKEINVNSKVISNSIGNEWFDSSLSKNKKYTNFDRYALYVSNFAKHKGHSNLLRISDKIPVDKIILVGSVCDNEGGLIYDKIKKHEKFVILSNLDTSDLIKLVDQASIILFPSFLEGYGIPIGEAIARNKRVYVNKELKDFIFDCQQIEFISYENENPDFNINNYEKLQCECRPCNWKLRWKDRAKILIKTYF